MKSLFLKAGIQSMLGQQPDAFPPKIYNKVSWRWQINAASTFNHHDAPVGSEQAVDGSAISYVMCSGFIGGGLYGCQTHFVHGFVGLVAQGSNDEHNRFDACKPNTNNTAICDLHPAPTNWQLYIANAERNQSGPKVWRLGYLKQRCVAVSGAENT
jgi:hypothetical protein